MNTILFKLFAASTVLCIAPLAVFLIDAATKKPKNMRKTVNDKHFTVRPPKWLLYIGIVLWICCIFMNCLYVRDALMSDMDITQGMLWVDIFTLVVGDSFFYLGLYLVVIRLTNKVVFYYDTIGVYRPLRKPFSFTFADVESVSIKRKQYYYYSQEVLTITTAKGKSFTADSMEEQTHRLLKLLKEQIPAEKISECQVRRYFDVQEFVQKHMPESFKKLMRARSESDRRVSTKLHSIAMGAAIVAIICLSVLRHKSYFAGLGIIVICICLLSSKK